MTRFREEHGTRQNESAGDDRCPYDRRSTGFYLETISRGIWKTLLADYREVKGIPACARFQGRSNGSIGHKGACNFFFFFFLLWRCLRINMAANIRGSNDGRMRISRVNSRKFVDI